MISGRNAQPCFLCGSFKLNRITKFYEHFSTFTFFFMSMFFLVYFFHYFSLIFTGTIAETSIVTSPTVSIITSLSLWMLEMERGKCDVIRKCVRLRLCFNNSVLLLNISFLRNTGQCHTACRIHTYMNACSSCQTVSLDFLPFFLNCCCRVC